MLFSIVIPAHDEEENVQPTVEKLVTTLTRERIPFEILVVNDHSSDRTEAVLQLLSQKYPSVRYVNNQRQSGFGRAIQTGLEHFDGDAVCIVMADASDDANDVVKYYRQLEEGYECVFGSRFLRQSKLVDYPRHKLLVNRLANRFINTIFRLGFNDTTNAFKAYRREVIAGVMPLLAQHFNITVELPLKAITRGYSYAVVPINWYNRTSGASKLKIKEMGSRYLFIVLYIWLERMLSRGDYLRPQLDTMATNTERSAALAKYETMAHQAASTVPLVEHSTDPAMAVTLPRKAVKVAVKPRDLSSDVGLVTKEQSSLAGVAGVDGARPSAVSRSSLDADGNRGSGLAEVRVRTGPLLMLLASIVMALQLWLLYGSAIHTNFVGDDWVFLEGAAKTPLSTFLTPGGGYHYNPILFFTIWGMYQIFGVHRVAPYHLLAFFFMWLSGIFTMLIARKLSGSTTVGVLAGILFIGFGTQYEAAVWGVVAFGPGASTVVYTAGLFCFMLAQDTWRSQLQRTLLYIGFMLAIIAGPFIYEQDITLVAACLLYRVLFVDASAWNSWQAIKQRIPVYLVNFALPAMFFCAYVAFKVWLGHRSGISQTPGLSSPWDSLAFTATLGVFQVFFPGLTLSQMIQLTLGDAGNRLFLIVTAAILVLALITFIKAKPAYRFVLTWVLLTICVQTLGLDNISSRHLLLMTVASSILWAATLASLPQLVSWIGVRLQLRLSPAQSWQTGYTVSVAATLVFLFAGYFYSAYMMSNWQGAVGHVDRVMAELKMYSVADSRASAVYLINLPDYVAAPTGESFYEFRNSPQAIVTLLMPDRFQNVTAVRTANDFPINFGYTVYAREDQITAWAANPANLVLQYDMTSGRLVRWQPLRPLVSYYNPRRGDHWVSTSGVPQGSGYVRQSTIAYLEPYQEPETYPLYGCITATNNHFLSTQANCEGSTTLDLEGWLYTPSQANVPIVPLYGCRSNQNFFISVDANCPGGKLEGLLGYASADQ